MFPQCANCDRFNNEETMSNVCEAFPRGIPEEVILGQHDHKTAFGGERTDEFGRAILRRDIEEGLT
jgi:hypothetical protein